MIESAAGVDDAPNVASDESAEHAANVANAADVEGYRDENAGEGVGQDVAQDVAQHVE